MKALRAFATRVSASALLVGSSERGEAIGEDIKDDERDDLLEERERWPVGLPGETCKLDWSAFYVNLLGSCTSR